MKKIIVLCAFIILCVHVSAFAEKAAVENIAVIVNSESPVFSEKENPEIKDIKDIYVGKVKYWKGSAIKAANHKDKSILERFLKKICGMRVSEYQSYWVRFSLESGSDIPKAIDNSKDIISFVQKEKTGIGYVLESEVKGVEGIKVILLINE
ncbi:MAG: hypothetical protein PHX78_10655 [bacterium]|nr:hypothetical protein [bacterium]